MSGYLSSSFAGVVFWKRICSQKARLREYMRLQRKHKCAVRANLFPCSSAKHRRRYAVLHACHHLQDALGPLHYTLHTGRGDPLDGSTFQLPGLTFVVSTFILLISLRQEREIKKKQ